MDNKRIASELLRMAKELVATDMKEVFDKYNKDNRDADVLNAFSENYEQWFPKVVKDNKLNITKSGLKKAKKFNKDLINKKTESSLAKLIANTRMVQDGKNPKQFNQLVDYNKDATKNVKKLSDAEMFVVFLMAQNV